MSEDKAALQPIHFHHVISASAPVAPIYFQACMGSSPLRSSIQALPISLVIAPFAFVAGMLVQVIQVIQKYHWANLLAWSLALVGFGLFSTLDKTSSTGKWGRYTVTIFPMLAPLSVARTVFFSFARMFAQMWGITIGSTVPQNQLACMLPTQFSTLFPAGTQIAYAAIPVIGGLEELLRTEVCKVFAESLRMVWMVMAGMSGAGLLSVTMMREVQMQQVKDETYGLEDMSLSGTQDSEKAVGVTENAVEAAA
ncbi:hypothetical protein LXA43DRAFT_900432 [Ganoderma leucocontextum]|nr:hypothetical protein LXA43DRAFT_900432 [Ganoderma leucocontextum]